MSASDPPSFALLCDPGAGFCRPPFSRASWLNVRPCQQRALENTAIWKRKRGLFPPPVFCFATLWRVGQHAGVRRRFLEMTAGLWLSSALAPCVNTASAEVWVSALQGPPAEFLSFLTTSSPFSCRDSLCSCSDYFRVLLALFHSLATFCAVTNSLC